MILGLNEAIPPRNLSRRFARGGFAAAGETGEQGVKGCVVAVCSEKRKHPSDKPRAFVKRQSEYRQLEKPFGDRSEPSPSFFSRSLTDAVLTHGCGWTLFRA